MGVRGLQTFIERHCPPECQVKIKIEQLVEAYRKENGAQEPTIVFDGSTCLRFQYEGLDWVSGGQFTEFFDRIRKFVDAFKELGVHCVFYFGGSKADIAKRQEWVERSHEKLKKVYKMFDKLADGVRVNDLDSVLFRLPVNLGFSHYLRELFACEVYVASNSETGIIDYASKNQCLAIFGQDTDYIIAEGVRHYLSAKYFNIETMTTVSYDRKRIAHALGLHPSQLPVFATLAGNRFVNVAFLKQFHKSLCRSRNGMTSNKILFPALGRYINKLPLGDAVFSALPEVAKAALNNPEKSEVLKKSICSYSTRTSPIRSKTDDNDPEWDEILDKAEDLHHKSWNNYTIYNTMTGKPHRCAVTNEDLRRNSLPPCASFLRPLRQRFYGILLREKPPDIEPFAIQEWCREGPDSLDEPIIAGQKRTKTRHPGLLTLWGGDYSEEMQNTRWKLFTQAVSPRLNCDLLQDLPDHLILPTPALFFLVEQKILEIWEIEALLATVVTLPSESLARLAQLPSDPVNLRAVQVATIFMRTLATVMRLLNACGFPFPRSEVFAFPYFDGKLFREKYLKAKERVSNAELCNNQITELDIFRRVRHILFESPE